MKYQTPKGIRDIIPPDSEEWQDVIAQAGKLFQLYGYHEIILPVMETTDVFVRSIGESSDIVSKEMFTFEDKGGHSLTLRPEATAGVARAIVQHSLAKKGLPIKLWYQGPMFRRERPQAGRYRQFIQLGAELAGSAFPEADAEIITLGDAFFKANRISNIRLVINSVGDDTCRTVYKEELLRYFSGVKSDLCGDCQRRFAANPLRILDCKNVSCRPAIDGAPRIFDFLCDACGNHFQELKMYLDDAGISYEQDAKLVRGLDYYTRTVFEFQQGEGAQNALAAGGRYDNLISEFGGEAIPATGFSIGLDRVMEAKSSKSEQGKTNGIYFIAVSEQGRRRAFTLLQEAHQKRKHAEMDVLQRSLNSQMKAANKAGYRWVVIVDNYPDNSELCSVKNMDTGEQEDVSSGEIWKYIGEHATPSRQ